MRTSSSSLISAKSLRLACDSVPLCWCRNRQHHAFRDHAVAAEKIVDQETGNAAVAVFERVNEDKPECHQRRAHHGMHALRLTSRFRWSYFRAKTKWSKASSPGQYFG